MTRAWRTVLPIPVVFLLISVISPAPSAASTLKVSSFPSGAQVIVDGVDTGKVTPMNISLGDGDHVVRVQMPGSGWNPDIRTVTIVSGNNDLSVTLLPVLTAGPQGPPGVQGPKGDTGPAGATGAQGLKGDKGDSGPQGQVGATGSQGLPGQQGPAGPPGAGLGYVNRAEIITPWANDIPNWEQFGLIGLRLPGGVTSITPYVLLVTFQARNTNVSFHNLGNVDVFCTLDDATNPMTPVRLGQYDFALSNNDSGEWTRTVTFHEVTEFVAATNIVHLTCTAGDHSPSGVVLDHVVLSAIQLGGLQFN